MKKRYIYTLAAALVWLGAGCNKLKDFGDVNQNPTKTTTPLIGALLTNAEISNNTFIGLSTTGTPANSGGQYAQYFSETQYSGTSLYNLPQNDFTGYYTGILYDLQTIINLDKSKGTSAVAKILQQYIYWVLTDSWGDLPYSEALKGVDGIQPKYDKQEDIYKGIIATLTSAQADLTASSIEGDVIYGGDAAAWKRAANSIKLLVAVQMSKVAKTEAAAAAKEAIAGGVIETNAQNMQIDFPGGSYKSPWYNLYDGRKDFGETNTMTDQLKALNDGRIVAYGGKSEAIGNTETSDIGVTYGLARNSVLAFIEANPNWARVLRGDFRTSDAVATIVTAGEVNLARAEAAYLGLTTESAATFYTAGITQSFAQWGLTVPASYLSSSAVTLNATTGAGENESAYQKITLQRWIASYPDGHQGWNVYRKANYPNLLPAPDATNSSKKIVSRFVYPQSEYSTNAENVKAAAARLDNDSQDAHVWWDVN